MKQKKPLKMFVPESAKIGAHDPGTLKIIDNYIDINNIKCVAGIYHFTRHEIHELVQAHAEKLEYWRSKDYKWHYDADCIYFWPDGEITMDGKDFDSPDITFQEISPFDFLKLTQRDVNDGTPINLAQNTVENIQAISTTDRNEKAWELFKILLAKPGLDEQLCKLEQETGKDLGIKVYAEIAFNLTDEFIKQAGNK